MQGHVDRLGEVIAVLGDGFARRLRVGLPCDSIALRGRARLDRAGGVSLTVAALGEDWVEVSLIPETLRASNLGDASAGDRLNVECDIVAKYVSGWCHHCAGKERA